MIFPRVSAESFSDPTLNSASHLPGAGCRQGIPQLRGGESGPAISTANIRDHPPPDKALRWTGIQPPPLTTSEAGADTRFSVCVLHAPNSHHLINPSLRDRRLQTAGVCASPHGTSSAALDRPLLNSVTAPGANAPSPPESGGESVRPGSLWRGASAGFPLGKSVSGENGGKGVKYLFPSGMMR